MSFVFENGSRYRFCPLSLEIGYDFQGDNEGARLNIRFFFRSTPNKQELRCETREIRQIKFNFQKKGLMKECGLYCVPCHIHHIWRITATVETPAGHFVLRQHGGCGRRWGVTCMKETMNTSTRSVSFVEKLQLEISDSLFNESILLADVDNDDDYELVVGQINGDLLIFKGSSQKPWRTCRKLGMITCVGVGDLWNQGENLLFCITAEGWCHMFYVSYNVHHIA